ncbi:MAG: DUF4399 domain-containing protein [Chloroflexota bacterium]
MKRLLFFMIIALFVTACGGAEPVEEVSTDPTIQLLRPSDGATVKSPVSFSMSAVNYTIEEAGDVNEGAGHFHIIVDHGCVTPGEIVPATEGYNHYGKAQFQAELELEPGDYDICLQVGDGAHAATNITYEISITVEE